MLICKDADNSIRWKEGERLDHLFEARCDELDKASDGAQLAAISDELTLTFRELDSRANQAARYLKAQGIKSGDKVGMLFDKSVETYIALLAVLKVNAAYVPFDGGFPNDRIAFILEDAGVTAIFSQSAFAEKLEAFDVPAYFIDSAASEIDGYDTSRLTEEEKGAPASELAYIIYTSGTTGNPKGVVIEHASICNFVRVAAEVYGFGPEDRVFQGMTIAFDFSVEELWVPLLTGSALVPSKRGTSLVGNDLADFLLENKVTGMCCVPTLLATIEKGLPDLRILLVSGEACPQNLVTRWHSPTRKILNAYGPTEATVTCTLTELIPDKPVTIGGPLPTYTIVVLDPDKPEIVPEGGMGEIGIAGIGLAKGYLNRPELTDEKFIPDFLDIENNPSKRIYRSGDLGCINADDEVEFHGRIDTQVKIRGYRIELTEIESILMELPEISQAVVDTYEEEPGATELVAYYSLADGVDELPQSKIAETLRGRVPGYMVPAYIEELPIIPMTTSNKADRKNLPAPKGPRFAAGSGTYVAPNNDTEKVLAETLASVMQVDEISVQDHFFHDLGAHSLLMARFAAEIRKTQDVPAISMPDIYQNPTIEQLAAHLGTQDAEVMVDETPDAPYVAPDLDYYRCGALQFLAYLGYTTLAVWVFLLGMKWVLASTSLIDVYLRLAVYGVGAFLFFVGLPIALKWALIGRWEKETIPVWSMAYFRFWAVKTLIRTNPILLFRDLPIYNVYLRLLGAKIGKNVVIRTKHTPVCTDLISIGDNTILRQDSSLSGFKAQSGYIYTGPVSIGRDVTVGEASYLDIDTVMEDGSQLGHASSLQPRQHVGAGKRFHGSPAIETTTAYAFDDPKPCSRTRKLAYSAFSIFASFFGFFPLTIILLFLVLHTYFGAQSDLQTFAGLLPDLSWNIALLILPFTLAFFVISLFGRLLTMVALPRVLDLFIEDDKTYVLYGAHYFLSRIIKRVSNSEFLNILTGDSSFIVYYLELIGYRLSKIIQTGSNFGTEQRHDNPLLCELGSGTMVSSGLTMVNHHMSTTSFKQSHVRIGEKNFLGNSIVYPRGGRTGKNCLLGTKVMVPTDGPVNEDTGLLGSPPFKIPRAVEQDLNFAGEETGLSKEEQLDRKNLVNLRSMAKLLLLQWVFGYTGLLTAFLTINLYADYGLFAIVATGFAYLLFFVGTYILLGRSSIGFRKLPGRNCLILDDFFWRVEDHWRMTDTPIKHFFKGTPFRNVMNRLLGTATGKLVFDDGAVVTERSLVEVGDHCMLGEDTIIQAHSLEEGVYKSDSIKIGNRCTVGPSAFVHYGVEMGDNAILDPDSFLMKGEILSPGTRWRGNPAKAISAPAALTAETRAAAE